MTTNRDTIYRIMSEVKHGFGEVIRSVRGFRVLDETLVPEGLRPHTRSICWLVEQVILQNAKLNSATFGFRDFQYPATDISVWDAKFRLVSMPEVEPVFVNIKISDVTRPSRRNDFASVKALLDFYEGEPNAVLLCVIFKFRFSNVRVVFEGEPLVKNYAWIDEFVVNPRNEHLQALYECGQIEKSTQQFIDEVKRKAREKEVL